MKKKNPDYEITDEWDYKEGIHFYYDEEGSFHHTEFYLKSRGWCCNQNCKHCPYKKELKVSEEIPKSKV